ncbi:MAG: bifunctional diguanylate cyclase/phosphodiesterase [Quadrisphaera sp.]
MASALVVVVSPFAAPGPVGASGAALGYLALVVTAGLAIRWRLRRTQTEHQLWRGLRASLWAVVAGVLGVWAATATALPEAVITAVLCAAVMAMMALTYLAVIRWTRPALGGRGVDPDHVVGTLCAVVVMTAGVQVVSHLVSGGSGLGFGTELPGVVAICANLVVIGVLAATNRGSLRRGDPRPLLMGTALFVVAAGTAVLVLTPIPLTPWALLVRTAWPLTLVVCAALPEVPRAHERQDVVISSVTGYAVLALSLPVVAVALLQHMPWVAAVAGLAALACGGRLLLDVRELRQLVANRRSSFTDELTGLPNRRAVTALLVRALVQQRPVVVAVIDLTRFKEVNDSLGHAAGDVLLRTVAARLSGLLQPGEVVARLGGDEFVVVAPCDPDDSPAVRAAVLGTAVVTCLDAPVQLSAVSVLVGASTGTAVWLPPSPSPTSAEDDDDPSELAARLLRAADTAMYDAKRSGGGWTAHDPARHGDTAGQLERVADLRVALAQRQLVLHHQPQVLATTGEPVGVEALVRWQHPALGLLGPAAFLDLAETHGLMGLLTEEVLRLGVEQQAAWRRTGLVTRMSVNLPASALRDVDLPRRVAELLAAQGVPASDLVLEVTESALLRDPERSSAVVHALRAAGARVSIDDFGTGYSSLARLRGLPVDELKLDASFTHGLLDDERARTIVGSTVSLAHALGLSVVAEGVEDADTLACLVALGCDEIQGYLFAKPMQADQLAAWWGARGRTASQSPSPSQEVIFTSRS